MAASIIKALFSPISVVVNFYMIYVGVTCLKIIYINFLESLLSWRTMSVTLDLRKLTRKNLMNVVIIQNCNANKWHVQKTYFSPMASVHQWFTCWRGCCFILLKPHILMVMKQIARFWLSKVTKHGTVTKNFLEMVLS